MQDLSHLPFYEKLTSDQKTLLLSRARQVSYKKGELIYSNTIRCLGVLLIRHGCLRTYLMSEQGRDITLYRLYDGDICVLSASCLLQSITFDVSIEAEADTKATLFPSSMFSNLMKENVYVENFCYKTTIERFSDVMWTMEQILFMSFDQRLAVFLLDEASKTSSDLISLTHAQIAKYMGSAREVVSRMLKRFETDHLVSLTRGGILLTDKKALSKIAVPE